MSHVVGVNCEFKDLDLLDEACNRKKVTLKRNQKSHRYYAGLTERCDHAIRVPGTDYEIGLRQKAQADTAYEPHYDPWGGGIESVLGKNLVGLQNEYLAVCGERDLEQRGFRIEREVEGDTIRLHAIR